MNPMTLVLSSLLLASAVTAGSINAVRHHSSYSSEETDINQGVMYGAIPKTFDAREHWKHCPSIGALPDQGCCDASYALIPAAVMTDRTCIATNSSSLVYSALDPLLCCEECRNRFGNCFDGDSAGIWKYWTTTGLSTAECLPYSYKNCFVTRECPINCVRRENGTVVDNKTKGLGYYTVIPHVLHIQSEIFHNGPVEAGMEFYVNFADGPQLVKSYVKIIGWGTDNGGPYWLVINTMPHKHGNEGIFKVVRGQNFRNIESNVRAAKLDL